MKKSRILVASAVAGLIAAGVAVPAAAQDKKEKCYGIAKSGGNDCSTAKHSCAGKSTTANDPSEWKYVATGTCEKAGGQTTPGKKPADAKK